MVPAGVQMVNVGSSLYNPDAEDNSAFVVQIQDGAAMAPTIAHGTIVLRAPVPHRPTYLSRRRQQQRSNAKPVLAGHLCRRLALLRVLRHRQRRQQRRQLLSVPRKQQAHPPQHPPPWTGPVGVPMVILASEPPSETAALVRGSAGKQEFSAVKDGENKRSDRIQTSRLKANNPTFCKIAKQDGAPPARQQI
ncbi:hypothetical protein TWF718_009871 [Orbilia javanica]|uniref:Uncharacterized protein n=1 Tax=Orbilia javanica TaxID=47235 RepID=A0AAN8MN36_9PEZI